MPKGIKGWSYKDVVSFLSLHGFYFFKELGGSHEAWVDLGKERVVEINKTKSDYVPRTLETMIRQSGINKDHWKRWTQLNKSQQKKKACCRNSV